MTASNEKIPIDSTEIIVRIQRISRILNTIRFELRFILLLLGVRQGTVDKLHFTAIGMNKSIP